MGSEDRRHLYSETVKVTSVFLDWRHKVMSFTLTVIAASVAIGGWMYQQDLREAMAVPALLAGLMAFAATVFDARNQDILYKTYRVGSALETALGFSEAGPLSSIPKQGLRRAFTYHMWLRGLYLVLAITSLGAAVWLATDPPSPPKDEPVRSEAS